jgi:glycosyltransferase involved in cell wall biosynthesis
MKILHYINNLTSGGAEKLLTDILPIIKNQDHEVEVLIINNYKNVSKYDSILKEHGIKVRSFQTSFYNPFQILKLVFIIKKEKYNIVHAHLFPSQYWLAFASFFLDKKTKLTKTEHSSFNKRRKYSLLKTMEKIIYNRYDLIIAISENVRNNLESWIGKSKKIIIIENGINLSEVQKSISTKNKLFSGKFKNILMVGRFDGYIKDHSTLLKAIEKLPDNIHLFFAGDGPNKKNVMDLVQFLNLENRVHFLGLRNDVINLMHYADLNVLSTNHEGFSGVTLESLASRKPFIGSDVEGVKEIVPNNSFLFSVGNANELSFKISQILKSEDLRNRMIQESTQHIKNFDISIMVNKYLDSYKNIMGKKNE